MRAILPSLFLILTLAACAAAGPAPGTNAAAAADIRLPPAPMNEQVLTLPGDPDRPVSIETTLFTPPGPGPFPLAVLNHGATGASAQNRGERYRYTYSADYFLSRGYAVALPMARGFAGSGGTIMTKGCHLDAIGLANAADLRRVIETLSHRPDIDPTRIIVSGQSFGGWTTMALGTMPPAGVRGLIGFSPALRATDCAVQDQAMIDGAGAFGHAAKLPSLWFYGQNDSLMPVNVWHDVFDAYHEFSRDAQVVDVGRVREDSHQLLSYPESLPLWTAKVDAFLAGLGMPSREIDPAYLPVPPPPPSHFARIDDVDAVPLVNAHGRDVYRQFLTRHWPRVFMITQSGGFAMTDGGFDPLGRALESCRNAGIVCQPYAVDDDVVWTGGASTARSINRTVPQGRATLLGFAASLNPDCTLKAMPSFTVNEPPSHGAVDVAPTSGHANFPPASAFAVCNANLVRGTGLSYTPGADYVGEDNFVVEETDSEGRRHTIRVTLHVQ